jgi:hypothetical protein
MKTKTVKLILLMVIGMSISMSGYSQKQKAKERLKEKKEQIEAARIPFFNNYLGLTTSESEKFWPVFNEYTNKQKELRQAHAKNMKAIKTKKIAELSNDESETLIKSELALKQSLLDLEKEYIGKFRTIISVQKVAKLKEAEVQFKKDLLQKARDKRKEVKAQK